MAIQNVNGRNVYVLSPKAPTGKTTSGRNWATLYSDLRWQVWEAQQKNEETKLKLDLQSAEARRAYYDDKIKGLQDQRKQLQAATLKIAGGDKGAGLSDYLRAAEGLERMARSSAGKTVEKTRPEQVIDGTTYPAETITTKTTIQGGTSGVAQRAFENTIRQYETGAASISDVVAAQAAAEAEARGDKVVDAATGQPTAAAQPPSLEEQLTAIDKQLEDLYTQKAGAGIITDTDLLNRTQRAFAENVGVIGQGGGPFGLAPRSRRLAPRVDQPTATAVAQELITAGTAEAPQRRQLEEDRKALLLRRAEILATAPTGRTRPTDYTDAAVQTINEQIADIDAQLSSGIAGRMMADESFIPRRAGEFLLRGPTGGRDEQPEVAVESGTEAIPSPSPVKRQPPQFVLPSPDAAGFPLDTSRRAEMEALGVTPEQPPVAPVALPPEPVVPPSAPSEMQPKPTAGTVEPTTPFGKEEAIQNPEIIDNPQAEPARDLVKEAREYYRGMKVSKPNDPSELKRVNPVRYFGGEKEMVKAYILDLKREEVPVGEGLPTEPQSKKTSKQRKDLYSFNVSSEGILLAQKPKKLERLAKTALPDDKRPQHIVIVDKLYETNANKANAFRLTYDEISRVFANDPKKRTEAHKYLVAKDVLEGNKREPLA